MSRLFNALAKSADGAFVTDKSQRIHYWNQAAEKILGYSFSEAHGQLCHQLLKGRDDGRHLICQANCPMIDALWKDCPVPATDLQVQSKDGEVRWLNVSLLPYRPGDNGSEYLIVHLFRDVTQQKADERFFRRLLAAARRYHAIPSEQRIAPENGAELLTPREYEVLTLMAEGCGTTEISRRLTISTNTVRNHVQNILQKFQVHTRLEAVTYAIRHNLIE